MDISTSHHSPSEKKSEKPHQLRENVHREVNFRRFECNLDDYRGLPDNIRATFLKSISEQLKNEISVLQTHKEESIMSLADEMKALTTELVHFKSYLLLKKNGLSEKIDAYDKANFYGNNYRRQQLAKVQRLTNRLNDLILEKAQEKRKTLHHQQSSSRLSNQVQMPRSARQPLGELKGFLNTDFN